MEILHLLVDYNSLSKERTSKKRLGRDVSEQLVLVFTHNVIGISHFCVLTEDIAKLTEVKDGRCKR